eukprot:gene18372-25882_t
MSLLLVKSIQLKSINHLMQSYRKICSRYTNAFEHKKIFENIVGSDNVLSGDDIDKYTIDWTKNFKGGTLVCLPANTDDVSSILKYCNLHNIAVVPQGGNTSLVGGSVGKSIGSGELIISLQRLNHIIEINEESSFITCEAGCILENLNNNLQDYNYQIPLDLGAKGSCMIGGNIATNAGGLRFIKYKSLHANVLGLEVVLANGKVLNMLRSLRKDNVGYSLKNLFIGSEGTLGIITKVSIALATKPKYTNVILTK